MKKTDENRATTTVVETQAPAVPAGALEQVLTVEEERVMRMRHGVGVDPAAPLGHKLDGVAADKRADLEARLALIEAEMLARIPEAADAARTQRIVEALKAKAEPTEG